MVNGEKIRTQAKVLESFVSGRRQTNTNNTDKV